MKWNNKMKQKTNGQTFFYISMFFHCCVTRLNFILFLPSLSWNFKFRIAVHLSFLSFWNVEEQISYLRLYRNEEKEKRKKKMELNAKLFGSWEKEKIVNAGHLLNVRVNARMHREARADDCIGAAATEETSSSDASLYSI